MGKAFRTQFTVRFRDADPAQIMFFGNLPAFAHDAFEQFIVDAGWKWSDWFRKGEFLVPIRHCEIDYLAPFRPGQTYDIAVTVAQIRATSFQMKYVFSKEGKTHGIVTMVHAFILAAKMEKTPVPAEVRDHLLPYLEDKP